MGRSYPLAAFNIAGTMRPTWLPHYLADYEVSVRVKKAGFKLLVTEDVATLTANEFGNSYEPIGVLDKFFSVRSPHYLPGVMIFWWSASSLLERVTLLPRMIFVGLKSRCHTL